MAVTIDPITDGDFTRLNRADAITGWTAAGAWSMAALNTASQVENTGCLQARVAAGIGSAVAAITSRSVENVHPRMWVKLGQSISAGATYGARFILGTATNHGSWIVYDNAKQVIVYNGWMMLVVDPRKPYDAVVGTAPSDILTVTDLGARIDFVDGNGKDLAVIDMLWEGNEVSIEGGTTGARGTLAEWATDDESNGYGILRPVGGVYYMNAGAVFQGVGTATSFFEDTNQLIVFEDIPVSGSLYKFRHVGNATGTNHFQLGTTSGSGVDQEGSGGGVIRAAGAAPFRIEAIDANIDACNYYGVTMLGPSTIFDDALRNIKVEDNGTGFTDITADANGGPGRTDPNAMPTTQALNDAIYFGHDERFYALDFQLATAKGGTWTGLWEYYDGTVWSALTDVVDGTTNFTSLLGVQTSFAIPDDWATTAIDSDTRYWIRYRISSFTSSGTTPVIEANTAASTVEMAGDIRLEDPNVDMVGCSLTGMGSIRVRNGAFLKKTTIDSTRATAKHAALDLGSADPAADTVRDLTIQNCARGVLLKGSGNTTYNIRNFQFSGNTNDFRIDFGAADIVTINLIDGSSSDTALIEANQDLVDAGTTVNFVNTVTLTVTVVDAANAAIEGAGVRMELVSDGSLVMDGTTNVSGIVTDSTFNYSIDTAVLIKVRLKGFRDFRTAGLIVNTGISVGVTLQANKIVDLP